MYLLNGFGLAAHSTIPLPTAISGAQAKPGSVAIQVVSDDLVEERWSGAETEPFWTTTFGDGCLVELTRGKAGDHLITYGDRARFHISANRTTIACAPVAINDLAWQRFLLDTVLHCTAVLSGFEALHASAVQHDGQLLVFVGLSGGGKTTLAREFLGRGARLFCDDILALDPHPLGLMAHPGPAVMNVARDSVATPPPSVGTLAYFPEENEDWCLVERSADAPSVPDAVFFVERGPGLVAGLTELEPSPLPFLPHSLSIDPDAARVRRRFEVYAELAARARMFRLTGSETTSPADLADLVMQPMRLSEVVA